MPHMDGMGAEFGNLNSPPLSTYVNMNIYIYICTFFFDRDIDDINTKNTCVRTCASMVTRPFSVVMRNVIYNLV